MRGGAGDEPATLAQKRAEENTKIAAIFSWADMDKDKVLNFDECRRLGEVTEGDTMTEADYVYVLERARATGHPGLTLTNLQTYYRSTPSEENKINSDFEKIRAYKDRSWVRG